MGLRYSCWERRGLCVARWVEFCFPLVYAMRESSSPLAPLRSKVLFCTGLDDGDSGFYCGLPCCNKLLYLCLSAKGWNSSRNSYSRRIESANGC